MQVPITQAEVAAAFAYVLEQAAPARLVSPLRLVFFAHNGTLFAAHEVSDLASGRFRLEFTIEHMVGGVATMPVVVLVVDAHDESAVFQLQSGGLRGLLQ
jgi:hypothetical protein